MVRVKSPTGELPTQVLTVGFCVDAEQEAALVADGVTRVWRLGRGLEELRWAISWLRGQAGILKVAGDFRIFGETRAKMMKTLAEVERAGIVAVVDVANPEDVTLAERIKRGLVAISNARFSNNPRKARRLGAKGGEAKGAAAWIARGDIAPNWLIANIVAAVGAVRAALILENKISASTLRRRYRLQT